MRKSIAEQMRDLKRPKPPERPLGIDDFIELLLGGVANPTQDLVIKSEENAVAYMGAAGVSKTSTLAASCILRAITIPNSIWCVARHDYNDLMLTTAHRMEEMLGRLPPGMLIGRDKSPPMRWQLRCADGESISEVWFLGLKDYPGSYEFHGVFVDEADEVDERNLLGLRTRLRAKGVEDHQFITQVFFNPPDKLHWLYKACTGLDKRDKVVGGKIFKLYVPAAGENKRNLPKDYDKQFEGLPEDMLQRLKHNQWGTTFEGMPVYTTFNTKYHVSNNLPFLTGAALFRFWDFGFRHPVCLFAQVDEEFRLRVIDELIGENETITTFGSKVLAKTNTSYRKNGGVIDFGDPAAVQKKDTGSTLAILAELGIELMYMHSSIDDGITRCRHLMERSPGGIPALQVSRKNAPILVEALRGGYRRNDRGDRPVKDGVYDHPADAFRYGVINLYTESGEPQALPDMSVKSMLDSIRGTASESVEYNSDVDPKMHTPDKEALEGWRISPKGIWTRGS